MCKLILSVSIVFGFFLSLLSILNFKFDMFKVSCSTIFSGETECTKKFPYSWRFKGVIEKNQRIGFGIEDTNEYQYHGNFERDKKNGNGIMKFHPTLFETYKGKVTGNWENNMFTGPITIDFYLNSTFRLQYEGNSKNNLINGNGKIIGYKEENKFFEITNGNFFNVGRIIVNKEEPMKIHLNLTEFQSINVQVNNYENQWKLHGIHTKAEIVQSFHETELKYSWDGKEVKYIETEKEPKEKFNFLNFMVKSALKTLFNAIRDFELYFLTKELSLRNQFDLENELCNQGKIKLDNSEHETIEM